MRIRFLGKALALLSWAAVGGAAANSWAGSEPPELTVLAYRSLIGKGSLGEAILPIFEKRCGCRVRTLGADDGGALLARARIDAARPKPAAQVLWGIDQSLWDKARALADLWGDWRPARYGELEPDLAVEPGFLPFDQGVLAMMADTRVLRARKLEAPTSYRALAEDRYRRQFVLEDPRTSTPGLAFLLGTRAALGAVGADAFWARLAGRWLTLAPSWDGAYGLFLKEQAPLAWSYVTSEAYHREHGDGAGRYRALVFDEGQPIQIEGAMVVEAAVKDPAARRLARSFLEFLLSAEAQERVPRGNWMLPSVRGTPLPESFARLPNARKRLVTARSAAEVDAALGGFERAAHGSR